jgi:hypothetical protein
MFVSVKKRVTVRCRIYEDLYKRIKCKAVMEEKTLQEIIEGLIRKYLGNLS